MIQGASRSQIVRSYATEQILTVTLRVSTNTSLACDSMGPRLDASVFSSDTDVLFYDILCDFSGPVADAGPAVSVNLSQNPTACEVSEANCTTDADCDPTDPADVCVRAASAILDGSASLEPETAITSYTWNCGNGKASQAGTICQGSGLPACVTCQYTTAVDFFPRLTVQNSCGQSDSETGLVTVN